MPSNTVQCHTLYTIAGDIMMLDCKYQSPPPPSTYTHTHGMQSFWVFIDPLVPDEIRMQLLALRNADSDIMKCRSWVRLMLSKSMMLNFLEDLQRHPGLLASHYGGEAAIRDTERFEVIIQLMKGVSLFQFDCDYTSTRLEGWDKEVLRLAGIWEPTEGNSGKGSPAQMTSPCKRERVERGERERDRERETETERERERQREIISVHII